CMQSLEFPITF
nr:immunoglobulin light chain junction region [Macaca mulatta]